VEEGTTAKSRQRAVPSAARSYLYCVLVATCTPGHWTVHTQTGDFKGMPPSTSQPSDHGDAEQRALRTHVLEVLRGGHAHATFDDAVADFPPELRGVAPARSPHSAWQLLEHIRLGQRDILEFSRNTDGKYESPEWPEGYWPASSAPPHAKAWDASVAAVRKDRGELEDMVADPSVDLLMPFSWGDGQTLLREALLVADHTAYHVGQLVLVRLLLGAWPAE
jgi:DinB superfamily